MTLLNLILINLGSAFTIGTVTPFIVFSFIDYEIVKESVKEIFNKKGSTFMKFYFVLFIVGLIMFTLGLTI